MNWTFFSVRSLSGFVISDSWGRNFVSISSRVSIDLRLGSTLYTAVPSVCGLCRWSLSLYWIMFIPRMPSSPGLDEFRDFQQGNSPTSTSHRFSTPLGYDFSFCTSGSPFYARTGLQIFQKLISTVVTLFTLTESALSSTMISCFLWTFAFWFISSVNVCLLSFLC